MLTELKHRILKDASKLDYIVKADAPNAVQDLKSTSQLVIWSGASDQTVWGDPSVNWAFRALHDRLHISTGLGFTIPEEIELGRIQASLYDGMLADLIYIEVAGQAEHFARTGEFIVDQVSFTLNSLRAKGYRIAA
jgi:hypothetical protein